MKLRVWLWLAVLMGMLAAAIPCVHALPGNAEAGQAKYRRLCVDCHGADGRGGPMGRRLRVAPRNLTDRAYIQTRSAEQLFRVIKDGGAAVGLSAAMPGFGDRLTDQEVWDTVAYVRTLAPLPPSPAVDAPSTLRLTRLALALWPEYDDPRVLLIMRGEVSATATLPLTLSLPLPHGGELVGAGIVSAQNAMLLQPHTIVPGASRDTLELTISSGHFFVELYYDPLVREQDSKHFQFTFEAPYAIGTFDVDIQQPYTATDFTTEPAAMRHDVDSQGGRHFRFTYQEVARGTRHAFTVRYRKTTDEPSVAKQRLTSGGTTSPADSGNTTVLAFGVLAGVVVLYTGGALVWGARRRRQTPMAASRPSSAEATHVRMNYCSHCGRQLQPGFLFCPGCGQALPRS